MQKRKIFIEIEVPNQVKKRLVERTEKWQTLPVKWTRQENLHITLLFLGYVDESVIPDICLKVSEAASRIEPFDIYFDKIEIGPNTQKPQMVWFAGEASEELKNLYEAVEKELDIFQTGKKEFRPHVTLGRIRKAKWESLKDKPEIDEQFKVAMSVDNILVMESKGEEGGQEYHVIESCPLA
ncbi:MAG: 2'-5' RNA ligase [Candidatus Moranbacteria bacterium GW2011_GWE1_49_15]|nr:MAG: 2'-5' RNA ligase [Candidatus Moranbacteria bacterium GW2011_GWE2_47_10]KKW07081.1 MAG: 2'-5' RNA ligase [Candidatus Moranbacteria bacterium GW2011_GWE1_49_15]HBP01433.1 RNA 2',3'-cyclic phosphodiesterase [Candidatus Moranbacteria bacterium]